MTNEGRAVRNRANAQKSTGPRTAAGKAVVAQNGRRHGVTAKPDPTSVVAWLRVILDDPDLTMVVMLSEDDRMLRALALAEAEVRAAVAEAALTEFEDGTVTKSDVTLDLREFAAQIFAAPGWRLTKRHLRDVAPTFRLMERAVQDATQLGGRGHLLRKRYLREARARRQRAFDAWLAFLLRERSTMWNAA